MIKSKLATLLFLYTALISNAKTENTINSLESFLQGLNSLEVDFTQILMNENGRELERANGVLYLKKPGKFYWNYQHPYSQKIITNGKILWIFDEDLEQVTIKNIDNSISKTPAGIILADDSIQEHFVQTSLGVIENFDWIELTPRYIEAQYDYIKIGFNKNKLGMMIIADNLGQTTRIDFSSVQKNTALSASFFNFDIPKNIDIFDERK